jgi:hypothetical protein
MKGYLKRLVLGVTRPMPSVHPLVGSVYAPFQHLDPGANQKEGDHANQIPAAAAEIVAAVRPAARPPELLAPQTQDRIELQQETVREKSVIPPKAQAANESRAQEETTSTRVPLMAPGQAIASRPAPLLEPRTTGPQPAENSLSRKVTLSAQANSSLREEAPDRKPAPVSDIRPAPASAKSEIPVPAGEILPRSQRPRARNGELQKGAQQEPPAPEKRAYQPIMGTSEGSQFTKPGVSRTDMNALAVASARTDRSDSFRRHATTERDEILIHIGRIEVIAVPPTPARPAAPTPRRGLNLQEYLKRSDRRLL